MTACESGACFIGNTCSNSYTGYTCGRSNGRWYGGKSCPTPFACCGVNGYQCGLQSCVLAVDDIACTNLGGTFQPGQTVRILQFINFIVEIMKLRFIFWDFVCL